MGLHLFPSHLSVFDLSEAVLEPSLLVVRAVPSERLRLDRSTSWSRSSRRPRGRGGRERPQGGTESRHLERRRTRSERTNVRAQNLQTVCLLPSAPGGSSRWPQGGAALAPSPWTDRRLHAQTEPTLREATATI